MSQDVEFQELVDRHYSSLYRFALSLCRRESDACDLTQQTFYIWARHGHQLHDPARARSWLFTTLYREHLRKQRRLTRFPESELEASEHELPPAPPPLECLDRAAIHRALDRIDAVFRAPLALFYLEDCSYAEIGEILEVPLGTVKSRISRGIQQMQRLLLECAPSAPERRPRD